MSPSCKTKRVWKTILARWFAWTWAPLMAELIRQTSITGEDQMSLSRTRTHLAVSVFLTETRRYRMQSTVMVSLRIHQHGHNVSIGIKTTRLAATSLVKQFERTFRQVYWLQVTRIDKKKQSKSLATVVTTSYKDWDGRKKSFRTIYLFNSMNFW